MDFQVEIWETSSDKRQESSRQESKRRNAILEYLQFCIFAKPLSVNCPTLFI